jgi:phytoene dehydrogenase-like protein
MKAVIIGAGIAGLTQGLLLRELGYEVVLCERTAHGTGSINQRTGCRIA